jgi:tRNA-specific 2-thiouridylase
VLRRPGHPRCAPVAEALGIPHYVLDYESRFRQQVIEDFADTYLKGSTPIPCVRCNQTVKFRDLLATSRAILAPMPWRPATTSAAPLVRTDGRSFPARLIQIATSPTSCSPPRAAQLDFLRFPLGGMKKPDVRRAAAALGLQVAAKPDSQDICFVPAGKYSDIVQKLRPGARGAGRHRSHGWPRDGPP